MPTRALSEVQLVRMSPRQPAARRAVEQFTRSVEALARQRTQARARERAEAARSQRALLRPFAKAIESDSVAAAALAGLRTRRLGSLDKLSARASFRASPPAASVLSLTLHEHLAVIGPPYDFEWQWGNAQQTLANASTGAIGVLGESGHFANGSADAVHAASGIGLILTTDKPALVSVRPFIQYSWAYAVGASGAFSSGSAAGGIDAAAFLNGKLIDGVHRSQVFSDSRGWAGTDSDSGDGIAWVPDLTVGFSMAPGEVYAVPFGAWVDCDHTSGIGFGAGGGKVQAQVKWVVVERFVAG